MLSDLRSSARQGAEDLRDPGGESYERGKVGKNMNFVPVLWSVWGVSVVLMVVVSLYVSRLSKNEEDQLFLADSSSHAKSEQDAIALKVEKVEPLKKGALILVGAMTVFVIAYYIFDAFKQFR